MNNPYPNTLTAVRLALAFEHDPREVEDVKTLLSLPQALRTANKLVETGRLFSKNYILEPIRVYYVPDAPDQFNHTRRHLQIGKPELIRLLHEIGHAKYGLSEERAVAYSLGLILKALPTFTPILSGHVLQNDPY